MSTIKFGSQQVQFNFNVPINVSRSSFQFETPEIFAAEVPWKIRLRKITTIASNSDYDSIEVCLICDYKETYPNWYIEAAAILRLLTYSETKQYVEIVIPTTKFNKESIWSVAKHLIFWNGLVYGDNDFIGTNKIFRFEAVIISAPLRHMDDLLIDINSTQFGLVLKDVEKMDFIRAPRIILRDTEWFIKCSMKNKWLDVRLFRKFESENFGWAFKVNLTVKLLSHILGADNVEYNLDHCFTSALTGVGWSKFISWDQLMDKKNGYVENNNAMFNITINVGLKEPFWECDGVRLATIIKQPR